ILLPGSKIAFHGDREGRDQLDEIYVMSADPETPERRVTNVTMPPSTPHCNAINPRWSRNGHRIAFHCAGMDSVEIYVINADGTGGTQLTDMKASDPDLGAAFPSWSPNGKKIAFSSFKLDPAFVPDLYVVDVDACIAKPCVPDVPDAGVTR